MAKSTKSTPEPGPLAWLAPLYAESGPILGRRSRPEPAGPYGWLASLYLPEYGSRRHSSEPAEAATGEPVADTEEAEETAWMHEVLDRISA